MLSRGGVRANREEALQPYHDETMTGSPIVAKGDFQDFSGSYCPCKLDKGHGVGLELSPFAFLHLQRVSTHRQ